MTERQKITIKVCDVDQYVTDWPTYDNPSRLLDVIAWFCNKLRQIPEKYRSEAMCEIGNSGECAHIEISYQRPETDGEQAERLMLQALRSQAIEAWELGMLAQLQAKYPKDG